MTNLLTVDKVLDMEIESEDENIETDKGADTQKEKKRWTV